MEELARTRDRLLGVAGLLAACLATGTLGYRLIEGWPLFDALYMTVITVGTVGYGETHPLSTAGRAFTMALILVGISIFTYGFSTIAAVVIEGDLSEAFRRRRMEKDIAKLSGHYVVCGAGHTGGVICAELKKTGRDFVVVDSTAAAIEKLAERLGHDFLHVTGDGTEDEVLRRAGVPRAAGVFAVLSTDQDNAFVVLSAKGLNPKARVLVCQKSLGVREKLLRSGWWTRSSSAVCAWPLLVAVVPSGAERYEINPPAARVISGGDRLVLIGETDAIATLRRRLGDLS